MGNINVLKRDLEISDLVETRMKETYQKIHESSGSKALLKKAYRRRIAVAAAVLFLAVSGTGTAYAMANQYSIGELFAHIWGGQTDDNVIDGISSGVQVEKEKSTFKNLQIKPVQAISDNFGSYIVFEVRGKNGFQLTDDMTFGYMDIENKQETASVMDGYVLKREEDVLYYAVWMMTDGGSIADRQQVFHVTLLDLAHAELYEDGTIARFKTDDTKDLGNGIYRKALKGKYAADICCEAADANVCVEMDGGSVADIHPLGIYVDKYLFDELGVTKLSEDQQKLHVLLKDGTEVSASLCTALGKRNTILRPEKPIDVSQVIGVRKLNQEYYTDKK